MSTVGENISILQSIFAPATNALSDYNRGRLALAQSNVRRAQELQDQQAAETLKRDLTTAQIAADDRRTQMYLDRQETANMAAAAREQERISAAQSALDDRQKAEEAKATRAAVRAAYAKYKGAGGKKNLTDFGAEDSANTLYSIQDELGPLVRTNSLDAFTAQAGILRTMEDRLGALGSLSPAEQSAARGAALQALAFDNRFADGAEAYARQVGHGISHELAMSSLKRSHPETASALATVVAEELARRASEKTNSKDYLLAERQVGDLRAGLLRFAQDKELPPSALEVLYRANAPAPAIERSAVRDSIDSSLQALREIGRTAAHGDPVLSDIRSDAPAGAPTPSNQPSSSNGVPWQPLALAAMYPGKAAGLLSGGMGGALRALLTAGRTVGQAVPLVRAGATGYLAGDALNSAPTWFGGKRITDYGVDASMGTYDDWRSEGDDAILREAGRMRNLLATFAPESPTRTYAQRRLGELQFQLPYRKRDTGAIQAWLAIRNAEAQGVR